VCPALGLRLVAGDVDGDGAEDLVAVDGGGLPDTISYFGGSSALVLQSGVPMTYPAMYIPLGALFEPELHDFDRDGFLDLLIPNVMNPYGPNRDVFRLPPVVFGSPLGFASLPPPIDGGINQTAADMDLDGDVDMVFQDPVAAAASPVAPIGVALNGTVQRSGCVIPFASPIMTLQAGTAAPGNAGFAISLSGAPPGAAAVLALSLGRVPTSRPCGIQLDVGGLVPLGPLGFTTTGPSGAGSVALPIPDDPALVGVAVHAQWLMADPNGTVMTTAGTFAVSNERHIMIW